MPDDEDATVTDIRAYRNAKRAQGSIGGSGKAGLGPGTAKPKPPKQSDLMIDIGREKALLFHSSDGAAWATVKIGGHSETWSLRASGFRRWLVHQFYQEEGS